MVRLLLQRLSNSVVYSMQSSLFVQLYLLLDAMMVMFVLSQENLKHQARWRCVLGMNGEGFVLLYGM